MGMRKILAHDIKMQKNPQTKDTFWIFTDLHHRVVRVQSPSCTLARKFHQCRHKPRNLLYAATFSDALY